MSVQCSLPPAPMRRGFKRELLMEGRKGRRKEESNRFLITVTVPGSAGMIRFVVREGELVNAVICTVLKSYAREGRLPVLGSDSNDFVLYNALDGFDALSPWEAIGSKKCRSFLLCKKQVLEKMPEMEGKEGNRKVKGGWKGWLNKSLSFRISPR